jgi:hypothetical protein
MKQIGQRSGRAGAWLISVPHQCGSMAMRPSIGNTDARRKACFPDLSRAVAAKMRQRVSICNFRTI